MIKRMFPVTEPYAREQYNTILYKALRELGGDVMVVYTSNYYVTVACLDNAVANILIARLEYLGRWEIEKRFGRKNPLRAYVQVKFNKPEKK